MSLLRKKSVTIDLLFLFVYSIISVQADCDKSKCHGPLKFYDELKCKPIYAKDGDDCCPKSYDCSHLHGLSNDKCYVNGKEYDLGEKLRDEDRSSPCDIGCFCGKMNEKATFICAVVDCFSTKVEENCYLKHHTNSCCAEKFCPKPDEEIFTCQFNGTTYKEGEMFYPNDDQTCLCTKDYKGENIEPFCKKISCGTELRSFHEIRGNCTPVFYESQSPLSSCSYAYRCPNDKDTVIPSSNATKIKTDVKTVSDDSKCEFGNITMNIGDELNQATDHDSVCVKCICEVPPIITCQRLSENLCDPRKFIV